MNGSEFKTALARNEDAARARHSREIDDPLKHPFEPNGDGHSHFQDLCWWCGKDEAAHKKAEDETERNTARELTIRDYKKDFGYGRYVIRGDGETIYGGNDLEAAIEAIAMHYLEMEG